VGEEGEASLAFGGHQSAEPVAVGPLVRADHAQLGRGEVLEQVEFETEVGF
jgi:hypothetical protein